MGLTFINAEKHQNDLLIFPPFSLSLGAGEVIAIHSNVNLRQQLIDLLLGKTSLSNGEIQVAEDPLSGKAMTLGFLFLDAGLYERLSVAENLNFCRQLYGSEEKVETLIRKVQLEMKRNVKISALSYSEKRRVSLAGLLLQNPDVYVMEEPDQNLDLESKRIFLTLLSHLRSTGKSIFILTGNLESAVTAADHAYRLDENGLHLIQTISEEQEEDEQALETEEQPAEEIVQPIRFEKIPTKINEKIVLFDPPEIDYIESSEGSSFLHIKGEAFPSYFTLNELEERLLPYGFFRCHRSYIVNLQKVREVITWTRNSYSLVLEDAKKSNIPLSKSKMAELKGIMGLK